LANQEALHINKPKFSIVSDPSDYAIAYYDLKVAAGSFSELQSVGEQQWIVFDDDSGKHLPRDPENYFACKVVGESMNKIIPNGSICLFERYQGGSRNGLICLVESLNIYDPDL